MKKDFTEEEVFQNETSEASVDVRKEVGWDSDADSLQ